MYLADGEWTREMSDWGVRSIVSLEVSQRESSRTQDGGVKTRSSTT